MDVSTSFRAILLDVAIGITVLGGGSVARVAQVSGLTWQHILPRLVPAPQAFTRDERPKRLSTETGTVVGVYSGNLRPELNFFACLLHPKELRRNQVELVEVRRKEKSQNETDNGKPQSVDNVYRARELGPLIVPSFLGTIAFVVLLILSARRHDKFAIAASVLLAISSTIIGIASCWKLEMKEKELVKDREQHIPAGDVLIHYSRLGAFRIIRCDERVSELYFRMESCDYVLGETMYRAAWLFSAMLLMGSIICIKRSQPEQLMAFSVCYIVLNMLYWLCAAVEPMKWHWAHDYTVTVKKWRFGDTGELSSVLDDSMQAGSDLEGGRQEPDAQPPRLKKSLSLPQRITRRLTVKDLDASPPLPASKYTEALWTAIALVGHSDWVYHARVAPDNRPWRLWVDEAGKAATLWDFAQDKESAASQSKLAKAPRKFFDNDGTVILPTWNHNERLTDLLKAEPPWKKRAPDLDALIELERAGYFQSPTVTVGSIGQPSSSAGDSQPQVASTGTDVNQPGLTLSPDDRGNLVPTGTRNRRTRSRENRHRLGGADVQSTESNHAPDVDERPNTPLLSQDTPYASGGLADKEKDGV